jgi:hypothetical protein
MPMKRLFPFLVLILMSSCGSFVHRSPLPTPPGWNELVSDLLVDDASFPIGWTRMRDSKDILTDSSINHVYRSWWWESKGKGIAEQSIWRAINRSEAKDKYVDLRKGSFLEKYTKSPEEEFGKFETPNEIIYRSEIAENLYYACGWLDGGECIVVAQYRNYVSYMRFSLSGQKLGYTTIGLTYQEIESLIKAMDKKFAGFLVSHPLETPQP